MLLTWLVRTAHLSHQRFSLLTRAPCFAPARQLDQVETAQAVAASAKVAMRMDAKSLQLFEMLMKAGEDQPPQQKHLRLLLENQISALRNAKRDANGKPIKSGRVVWHTEVLQLCTDVYRASPGAYEQLWDGNILCLPNPDTCRKRAATASAASGEYRELYDSLKERLHGLPPHTREMALLFDEINIVGDVAFKIVNGEYRFFGFIDVDGAASNMFGAPPKEITRSEHLKRQVATHALVFQVAELSGETLSSNIRFRQVVGVHGVTNLNASMLHKLFWRTVRNLHFWSDVCVVVSICDGASCNRLFQKMNTHNMGKGTPNTFRTGCTWARNPFRRSRKIFFMSDPAHWIKKVVTHWEKSTAKAGAARYLVLPDFIVQLILKRCPPPPPHLQQCPEPRDSTAGMECYCRLFGRVYSLLGGSDQPFYRSHTAAGSGAPCQLTPQRLEELRSILEIVRAWHAHNAQLPGLTAKQRAARGFSHQLFWDTQIMIEGFLDLLTDLQQRHSRFVVRARMLNQDSLESLFLTTSP